MLLILGHQSVHFNLWKKKIHWLDLQCMIQVTQYHFVPLECHKSEHVSRQKPQENQTLPYQIQASLICENKLDATLISANKPVV